MHPPSPTSPRLPNTQHEHEHMTMKENHHKQQINGKSLERHNSRSGHKRPVPPRSKGLGMNFFWGVLLFSLYWNIHFLLLHLSTTHYHLTGGSPWSLGGAAGDNPALIDANGGNVLDHNARIHAVAKNAFLNGPAPLPPPIAPNLTKELQELVDFSSPEMLLKTAWQSLIKQRSKKTPYRIITNVVPRKKIKKHDYGEEDFSLSTHATVGRLDRLLEEYRRWGGPVSAAVYISSMEEIDTFLAFIHDKGRMLKDIAIHVLMEDLSFMYKQYPNNILR